MPASKTLPQNFMSVPQAEGKSPISLEQHFLKISFPEQKGGEDYGVEKIGKINKGIGHKFW